MFPCEFQKTRFQHRYLQQLTPYEILESLDAYDRLISYAERPDNALANKHKAKLNSYITYFNRFIQAASEQSDAPEEMDETDTITVDTLKQ